MEELQKKLADLKERSDKILERFNQDELKKETRELEVEINQENFWDDPELARQVSQKLDQKQKLITSLEELSTRISNISELVNEQSLQKDLQTELNQLEQIISNLELNLFLSGPHDESEAILSVHAGTGGVEAMDWAAMLSRMYQRYFERMSWQFEITDESIGEEAGYKSITYIIHAPYSFGYLKGEAGTHRLVRLSPFNADHLRQTSFALIEILPLIENNSEIEIKPEEIEFEAFRSGGHGGQNVNKVSTAVRLKHTPSGIVVTAQTERSQLQNRENALSLLKARLWEKKQLEQDEDTKALKGKYKQASWGNQIRSYVLHPYHLVKDLRTDIETSDTDRVLDGNLNQFIEAEIRSVVKEIN